MTSRARAPRIAALVDAMRAEFGPGVRVRYAREGDFEAGDPAYGSAGIVPPYGVRAAAAPPPKGRAQRRPALPRS